MKTTVQKAFRATLPVLSGYVVLGFGFGILMRAAGFRVLTAVAMSVAVYAGSMQYVAVGLLTAGASLVTTALTTLMVNARHLFYGVSMLEGYRDMGPGKPYLIFALTDETYSLVCGEHKDIPPGQWRWYCLWVSALNHSYWVLGTLAGAVAGTLVRFSTEGIDFALTALFLTVFLEQWLTKKDHLPALTGVGAAVVCLLIFGSESFLIPTMLLIALILCLYKGENHG